ATCGETVLVVAGECAILPGNVSTHPSLRSDPAVTIGPRALMERALLHRQPWVRLAAIVAICLAVALPAGAVLGLAGALYGTALLIGLAVGYLMLRHLMVGLLALVGVICLLPFAALPI